MDVKLYALIKNMVKGITKGDKGETGAPGESGQLDVVSMDNPYEGMTLFCNRLYFPSFGGADEYGYTLVPSFEFDYIDDAWSIPADKKKSRQIGIIFTMFDGLTVGFPENVSWSVAEPVFEVGKTYVLSFMPFDDIIIGVWTVVS